MTQYIEAGKIEDIPKLGSRVIKTGAGDVAVFRTSDDEIFALKDSCPHQAGPLSQGIVHGKKVTCPLHNWVIQLEDGEVIAPDEGCAATYPVKIENDVVFIKL